MTMEEVCPPTDSAVRSNAATENQEYSEGYLMGAANALEWPSNDLSWEYERCRRCDAFTEDYQNGYIRGFVAGFAVRRGGK